MDLFHTQEFSYLRRFRTLAVANCDRKLSAVRTPHDFRRLSRGKKSATTKEILCRQPQVVARLIHGTQNTDTGSQRPVHTDNSRRNVRTGKSLRGEVCTVRNLLTSCTCFCLPFESYLLSSGEHSICFEKAKDCFVCFFYVNEKDDWREKKHILSLSFHPVREKGRPRWVLTKLFILKTDI